MHQLHADFKTWTKLKDKIVYDTYNNSIYERSHKILNEIKVDSVLMSRTETTVKQMMRRVTITWNQTQKK